MLFPAIALTMAHLADNSRPFVPVDYRRVTIEDQFWSPRQKALRSTTMRQQFEMLEKHHYRANFEKAAARESGGYQGYVFNDSDVYKVLEAGAYVLGTGSDPWLNSKMDEWIDLIGRAQESDGYLNTHFQLMAPQDKWKNLRDKHELYCAGHLFEAAAAHFQATGKSNFISIAVKLADCIEARFGPNGLPGYPGHPETELALFKLADVTGDQKYARLAEHFLNTRGEKFFAAEHKTPLEQYSGEYWSDNHLIRNHDEIVGHAVRAAYLFTGAADYAIRERDPEVVAMLDRVWKNTTERRMFVTGGLGPSGSNEGFTVDYDLPTFTAYQESCASIANSLWNFRLLQLHAESKYADVMETALYNGTLAGINLAGDKYFYVNPLASHGTHHRQEWFGCACCPPNLARLIGQVGGLAYGASSSAIYVNLFINGSVQVREAGMDTDLQVKTNYPWDGKVEITVKKVVKSFDLKLRQPGWLNESAKVDGKSVKAGSDGYITVKHKWKAGDKVTLELPITVRKLASHPRVAATAGMFALARGPLIYCAEGVDNPQDLNRLSVPLEGKVTTADLTDKTLGKIVALKAEAYEIPEINWGISLFREVPALKSTTITSIPYCMWDNRSAGEMAVWFSPAPVVLLMRGYEKGAKVALSYTSDICDPEGVVDGYAPATSGENSPRQTHFWPHKGGTEWIELTLAQEQVVSSARIFWFDDTGHGECRIPKSYRIEAWTGGTWQPVSLHSGQKYGVKLDSWNEVKFDQVRTQKLRLVIDQQDKFASGIHEWQVF
ncbi:MAG: glycoside hydrolase family 127 protein [Fimbriimonadaceae bacterium]|nr:glycoside hydrolase family 127 protein [Fimbriimonadaceae bacterium]